MFDQFLKKEEKKEEEKKKKKKKKRKKERSVLTFKCLSRVWHLNEWVSF